ncbi:MAG: DUF4038 domain-containing protein [Bryobacterales bacterium]|nr:DUF4038 domain-containing protein [Bryobacterales bacterium]
MSEVELASSGSYSNPYVQIAAEATLTRPDGATWRVPLFWDGGAVWKMRVSPDAIGPWRWRIASNDPGLDGRAGSFVCRASGRQGGLRASRRWQGHFERQNGAPFWFLGDTAWAYVTDIAEEKHNRAAAEAYLKARAAQGFNVIHSMLLSEGGDGNNNGLPWTPIATEQINPAYFREAEDRIAFANRHGVTVGIALAWGDKRKQEPFAWRMLPTVEARKRYARYVAARYSAYDVYFIVSGEWHGEVRTRGNVTEEQVFREFAAIGSEVANADPHNRMIAIHPMTGHGSVREFRETGWMAFADYQQNYNRLHGRALLSRAAPGPVVNSEYGYFLRDQNGDGAPDKSNSYSIEDMRHASWDIVMAGAYLVTGFGTTYFGGRRDPGPFDLGAQKNRAWETQCGLIRKFFEPLSWWKLTPADELVTSKASRGDDVVGPGRDLQPPASTYWALADSGQTYVVYVRGTVEPVTLELAARPGRYRIRRFDPRTGEYSAAEDVTVSGRREFRPPDTQDWVFLAEAIE